MLCLPGADSLCLQVGELFEDTGMSTGKASCKLFSLLPVALSSASIISGRPIVVVNGELDRIRTGYYPPFWARTEMQYLKTIVPKFMQVRDCRIRASLRCPCGQRTAPLRGAARA